MKDKAKNVRLGQEGFVVTAPDGEVERTLVGELDNMGYRFINGRTNGGGHWFQFDQAVEVADAYLQLRAAELRAKLRALDKRRKYLQSAEYRANVLAAPYTVVDLRQVDKHKRTRQLGKVSLPTVPYLLPGRFVYVVVTPLTRHRDVAYRPYKHFVLQTKVATVCFSPDGVVHYSYTTQFEVEEVFLSKAKALKHLSNFSEPGTLESTPYVSHEEERRAHQPGEDESF